MTGEGTTIVPQAPQTRKRTRLAFVVNNLTPYRVQSQVRFKRELRDVDVDTYITWDTSRNLWVYKDTPAEIGVVTFPDSIAESMVGSLDYYVSDFRTGGKVIQRLERSRPDAVVCCGYAFPAMFRVLRWCHARKVPLIMWGDSNAHADNARGLRRAIKNAAVTRVARQCDAILACGHNGARYWARYGVKAEQLFYAPVEPEYGLIEAVPETLVRDVQAKYGLRPDRKRLVVCSRLVPVKSVDQAIDAFAAVARKRPDWDLLIVGDGPLRQVLKARVPGPLLDRVTFAGFHDRQEVVNAFYRLSHVFLHPATWEPWGVVLLEAAAAGLAIITTHVVGAVPEVALDGVNAVLVRPNDRRGLPEAILQVTDPARLEAMRSASRMVSAQFRESHDPVEGLRGALRRAGVMVERV